MNLNFQIQNRFYLPISKLPAMFSKLVKFRWISNSQKIVFSVKVKTYQAPTTENLSLKVETKFEKY